MHNSLKLLLISTFILLIPPSKILAQDSENDLKAALDQYNINNEGSSTEKRPAADGYKSFVQNELQNIFAQAAKLDEQQMQDISFAEINARRIELAVSLCEQDQRACFLVDQYRSYKTKEDMPKQFEALKLFGQDIFSGYTNDFNFYDSLPIDNQYIIKIGDKFKISLFGGFTLETSLTVDINGSIIIPNVGK